MGRRRRSCALRDSVSCCCTGALTIGGDVALITFEIPFSIELDCWTVVGTRMICPSANLTTENDLFACGGSASGLPDESPVAGVCTRTTLPVSVVNADFGCRCGMRTMNGFAVELGDFFLVFRRSSLLFLCRRLKDFSCRH